VQGRVVVVTGAASGIGFETVRGMLARGARVAMVARDRGSGEVAAGKLGVHGSPGELRLLVTDLSSQRQVRALAGEIAAGYDHVDVLINNAGAVYSRLERSEDGIEMQFAINHLAPYLLTRLLREPLCRASQGRVVMLTSRMHSRGRIALDDLDTSRKYHGLTAYAQSKLANVLFTQALADRWAATAVTANSVAPGLVRTRIGFKHATPWHATLHALTLPFGVTPARAAAAVIDVATDPALAAVTGAFFVGSRRRRAAAAADDRALGEALWRASATLTGLPAD
jgi:NAD(P)-dependent dehydrogenase (short-subunit alcohol dehydrogenase family)